MTGNAVPSLSNLSIVCFWHRDEKIVPLEMSVGVGRIVHDGDGVNAVIFFKIRPSGIEFLENMAEGKVEVRYGGASHTNPFSGVSLFTASHIRPFYLAAENLDQFQTPGLEVSFDVRASCRVKWAFINQPIRKEDDNV